ncbi:MAG TPA: hypothetical protein VKV79_01460 [Terriglobia bacterium]|nr:hypothetical protein [Terriglobia bacterium]
MDVHPRLPQRWTCFFAAAVISCAPASLYGKQSIGHYDQLLLVRGLAHEVAVAKIPLPWGKHGIRVRADGQVDQNQAVKELHKEGESVGPGTPVEITGIKFKGRSIVFALNGGGKSGFHWWQHVELGMGPDLAPIANNQDAVRPQNGSYITVELPAKNQNPTVGQVKALLSKVLDFSRRAPTVLYSPAVPPKYKDAIKSHQVVVGMNRSDVLSAKGPPDRKVREQKPDGTEEVDWLYGQPPHVLFVIFNYDSVVAVHQY